MKISENSLESIDQCSVCDCGGDDGGSGVDDVERIKQVLPFQRSKIALRNQTESKGNGIKYDARWRCIKWHDDVWASGEERVAEPMNGLIKWTRMCVRCRQPIVAAATEWKKYNVLNELPKPNWTRCTLQAKRRWEHCERKSGGGNDWWICYIFFEIDWRRRSMMVGVNKNHFCACCHRIHPWNSERHPYVLLNEFMPVDVTPTPERKTLSKHDGIQKCHWILIIQ